jgi:hypothetical protein
MGGFKLRLYGNSSGVIEKMIIVKIHVSFDGDGIYISYLV